MPETGQYYSNKIIIISTDFRDDILQIIYQEA